MDESKRIELARQAHERKRQATRYIVSWAGGGSEQHYSGSQGLYALATLLKVTESTLNNYLCRTKGSHSFKGVNPTTNCDDIGTIIRISPPAKEKRPVGRPKKRVDWDRLGPEAPGYLKEGYTEEPQFFPRKHAVRKK